MSKANLPDGYELVEEGFHDADDLIYHVFDGWVKMPMLLVGSRIHRESKVARKAR